MSLTIKVPGSKSMTQRALIVAALADSPMTIERALDCDDSKHLTKLLKSLGTGVEWEGDTVRVAPSVLISDGSTMHCGNAGTAMRFGACLSLVCRGGMVMDGDPRMRERPIGPLGDALSSMGVTVKYLGRAGFPPLSLKLDGPAASTVSVDGSVSSQFASGLLMVGPRLDSGLSLRFAGDIVSSPYISMTVKMMESVGAGVEWNGTARIDVSNTGYRADACNRSIQVEADWSAAAFLMAASFISGKEIYVPGLVEPGFSLQGDSAFRRFLDEMKLSRPHVFDLGETPDLIAPLAAAALFSAFPVTILGAGHTRVKESDRIKILCRELSKLGARIVEHEDGMEISPFAKTPEGRFELVPENDHRMAMAFGIVSLKVPGIGVTQRGCVTKSFPDFWDVLERIRDV